MNLQSLALALVFLSLAAVSQRSNLTDYVSKMPDWPKVNYNIYSGQLILDQGDEGHVYKSIHYVFLSSLNNNVTDPVILWLNGGPGCSSMLGFATEIGQVVLEDGQSTFTPSQNPYSWNQNASFLFFESPPGVGFSQVDNSKYPNYTDALTTQDNYAGLQKFFELFPALAQNDFYIAGESYAGVYIPKLAEAIILNNPRAATQIKLKGILVGNGVTDPSVRDQAGYDFWWGHQMYSMELRDVIDSSCAQDLQSPRCKFAKGQIDEIVSGINPYDVYGYCYTNPPSSTPNVKPHTTRYPYTPWYKHNKPLDPEDNSNNAPCLDSGTLIAYFNRADVKQALNLPTTFTWSDCNDAIFPVYQRDPRGSLDAYQTLFNANVRILFYSGDTDAVVNFNEFYMWAPKLGLGIVNDWRQWKVGDQVAGFVTQYSNNFTFATVKGAGHMVPQWKRKQAFAMFQRWISQQPL